MSSPRIGIIEDEGITRDLIAKICQKEFGALVVASAADGAEGLATITQTQPDLVLLDICLPDIDGLDIAKTIRTKLSGCKVIALSALRDPLTFVRIRKLGLHGYVDKREQSIEVLKRAITAVLDGDGYFSAILEITLAELRKDPQAFTLCLSEHEQRILVLIGNGCSDEEIADIIGFAPMTAQSRRRDIMGKVNIHSTPKLIQYASIMGFTRLAKYVPELQA